MSLQMDAPPNNLDPKQQQYLPGNNFNLHPFTYSINHTSTNVTTIKALLTGMNSNSTAVGGIPMNRFDYRESAFEYSGKGDGTNGSNNVSGECILPLEHNSPKVH